MLTKRRRRRQWKKTKQNKTKQKQKIGLISKKKNFSLVAHFFVHFFAAVLHDDNVKLPKTSQLHVLWRKCCMWSCSLFFAAAHFYFGGR